MNSTRHSVECFRPLSGSYISQCKRKTKGENHEQFPSPIGELHFSIKRKNQRARGHSVSVPYRGATFLNNIRIVRYKPFVIVSVPYRGATFLNKAGRNVKSKDGKKFPSPIGELHFSMLYLSPVIVRLLNRFRPLSGSYISQSVKALILELSTLFPSPIGELHFSIGFQKLLQLSLKNGFRPLSGSYISQYHPRNPMSCLGRIGGLRGKSNFIEIQLFWKVKSSHKSSI